MGTSKSGSEEHCLEQDPDGCHPRFSRLSKATKPHSQDDHEDTQDEEHLDEDSVDVEFGEKFGEEMNLFGQPYNSHHERPSGYAAYHPCFAKVETLCTEVFEDAFMLLESSNYRDKYTNQLLDMISRKQTIKYDPPCRIGIIGDSGVGKWKLQPLSNAQLTNRRQELAHQCHLRLSEPCFCGTAVTCVITEFHQAPLSQETPFLAAVELFGRDQIEEILREQLQAYYQCHFESQEDFADEECNERELQAKTALDVLMALFAEKDSFRNRERASEFLSKATSKHDQAILQCFSTWIDQFMEKHQPKDCLIHLASSTADELSSRLEPWVTSNSIVKEEDDSQTPSFWPIVRIARVGMRSPLLECGVVITDLPGLSDTNKVRTMTTERYIRECGYYFLVAPIARVQSNDTVHRRLRQAYKLLPSRRALILTKTDDMPTSEKPRNLGATAEDAETYDRFSQALILVSAERTRLAKLNRTQKGKKRLETESKMTELITKKRICNAWMRRSLVGMRNKKVGAAIRKDYQTMTGDLGSLPIFNVSSKDYEVHRMGYDEEDIPLPLSMTGIPTIRCQISSLPAVGRQNVLQHHWEGNLRSVIASLDAWSSQSTIHRQEEIRSLVAKPLEEVEGRIGELVAALNQTLESDIMALIKKDSKKWKQHGIRLAKKWTMMNGQSFGAFVRKDGCHKPKHDVYRNWNSELLEPIVKDAHISWDSFEKKLAECKENCLARLAKLLENIRDDFSAIEGVSAEPMDPFLRSLPSKKEHLRRSLTVFFEKFLKTCREARLDTILEDDEGLLMQAMLPIYAKMRNVDGSHLATQRKTLLNDSMDRGEPYAKIIPGVRKVIEGGLKKLQPELVASVQDIFKMVLMDFDRNFIVEELPDPKRDVLKLQIKDFVNHASAKVDGNITTEWARATKGD